MICGSWFSFEKVSYVLLHLIGLTKYNTASREDVEIRWYDTIQLQNSRKIEKATY